MDGGGRARHGPAPRVGTGPLAGYESALRAELTRVGYAPASVRDIVAAMVRLRARS